MFLCKGVVSLIKKMKNVIIVKIVKEKYKWVRYLFCDVLLLLIDFKLKILDYMWILIVVI